MNAAQIFAAMAAQAAAHGVRNNPHLDDRIQLAGKLMEHASNWAAVSASGITCAVGVASTQGALRCTHGAIGACVACGNGVCFHHAMIAPTTGDMICYGCVARAGGSVRQETVPPRPPSGSGVPFCTCRSPDELSHDCALHGVGTGSEADLTRKRHLRTLGLDSSADWEDIRLAHKDLAKRYHPDKMGSTRKMQKINEAYTWLKAYYEDQAA